MLEKHYKSIDEMPVYNWFKCIEKKEYKYCMVDCKKFKESQTDDCMIAFESLYCEYLDKFGVNDDLQSFILKQNEILSLKIDRVLTEDPFLETIIELKETEMETLTNKSDSNNNTAKVAIEKYLGFRINEREITVKEYYEYLKEINNGRATN
jgi:hypothetical protein